MRRLNVIAALLVGLVAGFAAARYTPLASNSERERPATANAVFRVQTDRKVVAFTFDDGPDPRWTPTVLQLLRLHKAKATFFLIGQDALAHPDLVAEEMAAGCEIGNHTFDHPDLELLPPDEVDQEIEKGADAVQQAGAPRPTLFRPPRGLTDEVVGVLADAEKYRTVFWELGVEHFANHMPAQEAAKRLLDSVRPGSIILAHDGGIPNRTHTMQVLPLLLDGLDRMGYRVVDVDELLRLGKAVNRR
jgi:peptidoglycan/xylan/chitin deacetylase (PgdA/CDA1 family)